jgi:hypothetical protein
MTTAVMMRTMKDTVVPGVMNSVGVPSPNHRLERPVLLRSYAP